MKEEKKVGHSLLILVIYVKINLQRNKQNYDLDLCLQALSYFNIDNAINIVRKRFLMVLYSWRFKFYHFLSENLHGVRRNPEITAIQSFIFVQRQKQQTSSGGTLSNEINFNNEYVDRFGWRFWIGVSRWSIRCIEYNHACVECIVPRRTHLLCFLRFSTW